MRRERQRGAALLRPYRQRGAVAGAAAGGVRQGRSAAAPVPASGEQECGEPGGRSDHHLNASMSLLEYNHEYGDIPSIHCC
jgi:hypothetical protein